MFIVIGLPGAGKSTILSKLKERHPEVEVYNYGTLMMEFAKERFSIDDRDKIRKDLTTQQQKELQRLVENRIRELSKEEGVKVLDTHAAIKTPEGFLQGLPWEFLKTLKVDGIIYITAPYQDIIERRRLDTTRERDEDDEETLRYQDMISLSMCSAYSVLTGAKLKVVINNTGRLEEAVREVEKALLL